MLKKLFTLRFGFLLCCCAAVVGGIACFTPEAQQLHRKRTAQTFTFADSIEDEVFASATVSKALEQKLGCTNAVAFLGSAHTYILTKGGEELLAASRELPPDRLRLDIHIGELLYHGDVMEGGVRLLFANENYKPVEPELVAKLERIGFVSDSRAGYSRLVMVRGSIQAPLTFDKAQMSRFTKTRRIQLSHAKRNYHVFENVSYYGFKLPLAIVEDTALVAGVVVGGVVAIAATPVVGVICLLDK
jgi:hypothetical protein